VAQRNIKAVIKNSVLTGIIGNNISGLQEELAARVNERLPKILPLMQELNLQFSVDENIDKLAKDWLEKLHILL